MEETSVVQRLVEILAAFFTHKRIVEEDLAYSLTREFLLNVQDVLFAKQVVSYLKFKNFFADCFKKMLLCPELYLRHVFYACQQEAHLNLDIFETFLSVYALILRISVEMRDKSGMDFCKLAPDVFMVFYKKELEKPFRKYGGFRQFVKFVNNPKYLESKCIVRNIPCDPYASNDIEFPEDSRKKTERMVREEPELHRSFNSAVAEVDLNCQSLAKKVLKIIKTKSSLLPRDDACKVNLSDSIQQKITSLDKMSILKASKEEGVSKLAFESCPILSSDSKTSDDAVVQMADDERYDNIIEAVINYNNSKSCHAKPKDQIQTEAHRNLENLKNTINSLIQVLNEYDKE